MIALLRMVKIKRKTKTATSLCSLVRDIDFDFMGGSFHFEVMAVFLIYGNWREFPSGLYGSGVSDPHVPAL